MRASGPVDPSVRQTGGRSRMHWVPGIAVWRSYQRAWWAKDIFAGVVLTAILVPAIYGLYATIAPLVAYAVFVPSNLMRVE